MRVFEVADKEWRYHSSRPFWAKTGVSLPYLQQDYQQLESWYTWLNGENLLSDREPVAFFIKLNVFPTSATAINRTPLWLYQDVLYQVKGEYSNEEEKLLVLDYVLKQTDKFNRLRAKLSDDQPEQTQHKRTKIPENVRIEVWRRDQGKCAGCGSRVSLEYDHIVPVSRGGSNTARNVELLCEACNRSKGDRIQ